jgi:TRAP-type C4-dicarboxylate transport system permease small subunit
MKNTPITQRISSLISWVLVVDLGLVLLSLGWFIVAVLGRSMNLDLGLDQWYSLWNPLILPAISVLMAGAIASGVVGWIGRRFNPDQL